MLQWLCVIAPQGSHMGWCCGALISVAIRSICIRAIGTTPSFAYHPTHRIAIWLSMLP